METETDRENVVSAGTVVASSIKMVSFSGYVLSHPLLGFWYGKEMPRHTSHKLIHNEVFARFIVRWPACRLARSTRVCTMQSI